MNGFLADLKEIVVTIAAATGAVVAVKGLSAWRRQLAGKTEYDVALRLLRGVYKVRDAINLVRAPFMTAGEMESAVREVAAPSTQEVVSKREPDATVAAYQVRWKSVVEAVSDLQVVVLEAEVIWGRKPPELAAALRKCVAELNWALSAYLRDRTERPRSSSRDELYEKAFKIVFWHGDDPGDDPFLKSVTDAVARVEEFVRPRLK